MPTPDGFRHRDRLRRRRAPGIVDGRPEIDLQPVSEVRPDAWPLPLEAGERRIGFALVGVPHLVILCDDVATVDVVGRGRPLRYDPCSSRAPT